ncbi:hypothetical protein HCX48_02355 [Rhodocyclus tenuis]|uniref:DNA primase/polymerase bifunctional N-terminal domain-containing protein n=1 Tax=Rhodocyclus gracilis TaxID=2929842 RepID=A0ABX0WEA8_9RHOO|nr:bifunctional DNA primase/polymerase [Rhodocyclus gracilis]NJA88064.1 hypothetical protein [Rhodocyclus gracilis]
MFPDTWQERNKAVCAAALEYARMGFHVFPLHGIKDDGSCACGTPDCKDAGKHPFVKRGLKEATRDEQRIKDWFGLNALDPRNVGIVTGEISGITVIDVDIADGKGGAESWHEATKEHGEPQTLMAQTGSGGMHVFFKYNSALKTASNVLGKGVDVRNNGGYIVAAPSRHRSGGSYSWQNWDEKLADLPEHLSRRKETRGRKPKSESSSTKYTIEQVRGMLEVVPADERDLWRNVGIILGRQFNRTDAAWEVYQDWANKAGSKKGRNHDAIMTEAFYELSQQDSESNLTIGTIVKAAQENGWAPGQDLLPSERLIFDAPGNVYIDEQTGSTLLASVVDSLYAPKNIDGKIVKPSEWAKKKRFVLSKTSNPAYAPGRIQGIGCRDGGETFSDPNGAMLNTYSRPTIELGDASKASPFVQHAIRIFNKPGDADQFLDYMAHRVQKPWEKPRFALLIAGGQGVGKDTAVEFCCPAIGSWNVANIEPSAFDSQFNEYAAATLVRINETSNLHEMSRWAFNERTKVLIAGSPDNATINPKYGQKYSVRMYCGVILTTNHLTSGIYIPADDRRYDVIESATLEEMGLTDSDERRAYFERLWGWFYEQNGANHVAAYLHERDISRFSASNGQRKTEAHKNVVQAGMSGDHWLDDIIDELGSPVGVRADWIIQRAVSEGEKEGDVRNRLGKSITRLGYVSFRNPHLKDGRWKIGGKKVVVYVKQGTPLDYDPTLELNKEPF